MAMPMYLFILLIWLHHSVAALGSVDLSCGTQTLLATVCELLVAVCGI